MNFKTKIMATALAATLLLGGATVFADETEMTDAVPGSQVFSDNILIPRGRKPEGRMHTASCELFTVPVSGEYYFTTSGNHINEFGTRSISTSFTINGCDSNNSRGGSNLAIHLEAGQVYSIIVRGDARGGSIFSITGSLLMADGYYQEEIGPDSIYYIPEEIIPEEVTPEEEISDAATPEEDVPEAAMPEIVTVADEASDARLLSVRNFIGTLYNNVLGRQIEADGSDMWVDKIMGQAFTGTEVVEQMFASSEFASRDLSDEEFIDTLFAVFGTDTYDADEIMLAIADGKARIEIVSSFTQSEQWASYCAFYGVNV